VTDRPVAGGALCSGSGRGAEGVIRRSGAAMPVARWRTRNCAERPAALLGGRCAGLSLGACFCQGQIKKALSKPAKHRFSLFRTAHSQNSLWPLGSLGSKSLSSGAKFRPEGGRIRIRGASRSSSRTRGRSGSPASPLNGGQSQTVHVSFPAAEAVAFAQLVERVEPPGTGLVDEAVGRGAHGLATPSRGTLPLGTQAS
jgi:hypothetical protein